MSPGCGHTPATKFNFPSEWKPTPESQWCLESTSFLLGFRSLFRGNSLLVLRRVKILTNFLHLRLDYGGKISSGESASDRNFWVNLSEIHNWVGGFLPTHLKNMRKSKWVHLPQEIGVKIQKIFELPPPR